MTSPVLLLPLDDRPVNTSAVEQIAAAAGAELILPGDELLPPGGQQADVASLIDWLEAEAPRAGTAVVALNQLLYGGYVASRRTSSSSLESLQRLTSLNRLGDLRLHAFMTLMRTRHVDGAGAEPLYWEHHGADLFRLSEQLFRREHGLPHSADLASAAVPEEAVSDWLLRRLRLHITHLACLEGLVAGPLDTLAILVEDSTPESVSSSEREWLQIWIDRLALGDRAQIFPGADEAGAVLVARSLLEQAGRRPTVAVVTAGSLDTIAPFEDVPLHRTVAAHVAFIGGAMVDDVSAADLVLVVHTSDRPRDWCEQPIHPVTGRATEAVVRLVEEHLMQGRRVTVADVADANGSDPDLVRQLISAGALPALAGYAGWNTAGNSIGSALAQGCATLLGGHSRAGAQQEMLVRRLVDDWAFQTSARASLLEAATDMRGLQAALERSLDELGEVASGLRIVPGSVRLPWGRAFEVDFGLERSQR